MFAPTVRQANASAPRSTLRLKMGFSSFRRPIFSAVPTPPPMSCPASFAAALDTTSEMTMVYTRFCPRKK